MKNLEITGTLTFDPPDPLLPKQKYVFQRVAPGLGNLPDAPALDRQMRRHVIPLDPMTPAQLARRAAMAAAVAAWHTATPQERDQYQDSAKQRGISLFNAFISARLKTPPP